MAGSTANAGFVPVDAIFSGEGSGYLSSSAGEKLREARQKAGLTLDSAAARTRIRRDYLEALEDMDPRGLPARAYAIGYLRTYASFLELSADAVVEQFKREVDTETGRAQPSQAAEKREIKLPRGVFGALLILVSVAAVAWWYLGQTGGQGGLATVPPPPDAGPEWARDDFDLSVRTTSIEDIWADLPSARGASEGAELVLRATAPTWLEVRDSSGRILFARELQAGEAYRASEDGLTVSAANAGAVAIEIDGEEAGRLGQSGAAVENLAMELAALQTAAAAAAGPLQPRD